MFPTFIAWRDLGQQGWRQQYWLSMKVERCIEHDLTAEQDV